MKIIDLLNKIANGEIPKIIVYDERYFTYDEKRQNYFSYDDSEIDWKYTVMEYINDEVEIIEEDKKIEKLPLLTFSDLIDMDLDKRIDVIKENRNKINEIIDKVNSLENKQ